MDELRPGERFAGCRIEAVAGRGGMGVVYRATELALSRRVALKVVAPESVADTDFTRRFGREVRMAASIDHPNIVPVYGAGEENGRLYLVMRYVDGTDLQALVRRAGRLEPSRAAAIVAQVAAGLDAAHASGLVHRDVKPANVLITLAGTSGHDHVYLTDFGLTVEVSSGTRMTTTGHWIGSVDYMAPEQLRAEPVDARTDVYALGGVLHAALTGEAPFSRGTVPQTIAAHLNDAPPRPTAAAPVDPAFDAVVARALAKDPADRYRSAGDLGRAAQAAARGERITTGERVVARGAAAPSEDPTSRLPAALAPTEVLGGEATPAAGRATPASGSARATPAREARRATPAPADEHTAGARGGRPAATPAAGGPAASERGRAGSPPDGERGDREAAAGPAAPAFEDSSAAPAPDGDPVQCEGGHLAAPAPEDVRADPAPDRDRADLARDRDRAGSAPDRDRADLASDRDRADLASDRDRADLASDRDRADLASDRDRADLASDRDRADLASDRDRADLASDRDRADLASDRDRAGSARESHRADLAHGRDRAGSAPEGQRAASAPDPDRGGPVPDPRRATSGRDLDRADPGPDRDRAASPRDPDRSDPGSDRRRAASSRDPDRAGPAPDRDRAAPAPGGDRPGPAPEGGRGSRVSRDARPAAKPARARLTPAPAGRRAVPVPARTRAMPATAPPAERAGTGPGGRARARSGAAPAPAVPDDAAAATRQVRRHRSRSRALRGLAALIALAGAGAAVGVLANTGDGARPISASLAADEIRAVVRDFAAAYGDEDVDALRSTLARNVQRVAPDGTQRGRPDVLAVYRRQFAAADVDAYELDDLDVIAGAAGRAAGRYTVRRSGREDIAGRVAFGVVREGGRPRIALIATQPDR